MSLFYQLQGFTPEESQRMAERLAEQPDQMVQAMAQHELGLSPSIGSRIIGNQPLQLRSRPPSAPSSQLFLSFS